MKKLIAILCTCVFSACTSTTRITSSTGAPIAVNEKSVVSGSQTVLRDTSFGQYKFRVTSPDGSEELAGILPLKFNSGYLALDILLFAPGMFFNLRSVYPEYEIDTASGVIRYRKSERSNWVEYRPKDMEQTHAQSYFEALN